MPKTPWLVDALYPDAIGSGLDGLPAFVQVKVMTGWLEKAERADLLVEVRDFVKVRFEQQPGYENSPHGWLDVRSEIDAKLNGLRLALGGTAELDVWLNELIAFVQARVRLVADGAVVQTA